MAALLTRPPGAPGAAAPATAVPGAGLLARLSLGALAVLYIGAGIGLRGSSWILPDGLLAGGVALLVLLPWIRGGLDALLVILPFMFYTLSPIGGILTVGTSDSFLPIIVIAMVVGASAGVASDVPRLRGAGWFLVLGALLMIGTTAWWNILSPGFILSRAVADGMKLAIGIAYLVVVYQLAVRAGLVRTIRSVRLWLWTAAGLSLCVVVGAVVGVELVPTDGYRSLGYFEDANLFAGYLLVSLALVLFLAFSAPSPWLVPQAVIIVLALVATGSRGGMVSLALLGAFTVLVVNSLKLRVFVLGAVAAGTAVGYSLIGRRESGTTILGLDRLFFASQDVGDDPRVALWVRAVEKWLDAPIWGIGMGQFERFSGDVFRVSQTSGLGYVTHNSFLYFLASFGLLGGALFVGFLVWLVVRLYAATGLSLRARHGLAAGMVMICSQMITLNLQNLRYVWAYFGVVLALAQLGRLHDGAHASDGAVQGATEGAGHDLV